MLNANVRPARDLRNNYADIVRSLNQHDHVIITNNGVGEAVVIGIKDYAKYEEYLHRRFIFEELQKTKAKASDPDVVLYDAVDVFAGIEKKLDERSS
ncbi:MAG: type II toxin-antitoxin system prevent-host-death family antitoxin [Oscillospiraceae bacterium]|nr:type II toxin-antitoxin system prevent-host-death family antitoxin [Oscillospiraceae bacterium]